MPAIELNGRLEKQTCAPRSSGYFPSHKHPVIGIGCNAILTLHNRSAVDDF
jgi:hypothetical protein